MDNFPGCIFHHVSFSWLSFYTVFSGWSTTSGWAPEKTSFFRTWHFFVDVFSRETIRYFLAPALSLRKRIPYLSANRLEPRISRDQHIQTCHFKTTNVKIHPVVPKVYTHLISFGQMEMANASGNFGNALGGWERGMMQSTTSAGAIFLDRKKTRFFGCLKKCCFFGPRLPDDCPKKTLLCGWLAIWLTGWLSGWLAGYLAGCLADSLAALAGWLFGNWLCGCLAGYLAIRLLAIWLTSWLADWHWLSGWLSEWLALWLAIWLSRWLVGHLAGWLSGRLIGWWLARWLADCVVVCSLAGWLTISLFGYLAGCLPGYLVGWLFGWLAGSLSG